MKTLLLNLWAWVLLHPAEVVGALYLALNAINAAIPVERRKSSLALRVLDRICIATQRGAVNASSWPVAGKSLAKEIASAVIAERETQAPSPPSEPGYVEPWVLVALVVAVIAALAAGCSGGSLRDALRFNGVREVRHPVHGDCIEASLTVTAESINRSGTGYLGVCRGVLDAGAASDAGGAE